MSIVITGVGLVRQRAPVAEGESWFDPVPLLGRRGWKYLTPAARYLLGAARLALEDAALETETFPDESMGVAIGTNFAAEPVVARLDEQLIAEGARMLSPAEAPNFSVNIPASGISMRYGMRAFNLTLTSPMVAGLESILVMGAAIRRGRARLGIAGATEQRPRSDHPGRESACCLVVEGAEEAAARGARVKATITGGWCRFSPPAAGIRALQSKLAALIEDAADGQLPYSVAAAGRLGADLDELCHDLAAKAGVRLTRVGPVDASYVSVSPLLAVADQLASGQAGLVVTASGHGNLAALRLAR